MRSQLVRTVAALTMLLLAGACGSDTKPETEFENFESTGGRFSADFPGEPKEETQSTTAEGLNLDIHFFTSETDDYAVSVGYVDYPEEFKTVDPKLVLSGVAAGAAGNVQGGEVTKSEPGTFQGVDSVDYEVKADDASLQAKAFLKENRLYLLQAVSAELPDADAEYDRLVESFRLL
ncbi:MAG TPA: hypothetical protein VFV09_12590 [Actinomycetota bacterium]|jgi:hypothetical protein|nr:hypothetical protein [Actinomycetota bacterium]